VFMPASAPQTPAPLAPQAPASPGPDPSWTQTTWIGGRTTPSLEVGTWDSSYNKYYTDENENNAGGELKLSQLLDGWTRRKPITITNSHPSDYQLKVVITYDSDMKSDFSDLRFLENEAAGELNYWIENYTADNATVWVRRVQASGSDSTIYVYYGNPSASSESSWENTILPYTDSLATVAAGWSARWGHTSVVFDGKMWVIGGYDGAYKNDVWYSSDGVTWTEATDNAGWDNRYCHTSVVFDGKMWVIGGYDGAYENDVWYSSDGENWTQATGAAGWSARAGHTSVVFDGKMWVIGGYDGAYKKDVWYSSDGVTWTEATGAAGWTARRYHTSVVFDGKMWVIGGYDGAYKKDVWT
jgi:hypothetical protein